MRSDVDVLVLGMHRSGTSALSGALHALGFRVPLPHIPVSPDNPSGFWENVLVRDYNEQVLEAAQSSWHDPLPLSPSRLERHRAGLDARLSELLQQDGFAAPCLIKDPRLCISADLWLDALARCGRPVACILMGRHPAAVAASLQARNGISGAHALALWAKHVFSAERLTRGRARTFVLYDDLLHDWRATVGRIIADLGFGPFDTAGEAAVDAFLCANFKHHDPVERDARSELEMLCLGVWRCFSEMARHEESQALLDELSALETRYTQSVALLAPLLDKSLTARSIVARNQPSLDGARLQVADTPDVWLIFHGRRHRITSPHVYDALFSGIDRIVTMESVDEIELGAPLGAGACLIRAAGHNAIYLLNQTKTRAIVRHHIVSLRSFQEFGFDLGKVKDVPPLLFDLVPEGREIRCAGDG